METVANRRIFAIPPHNYREDSVFCAGVQPTFEVRSSSANRRPRRSKGELDKFFNHGLSVTFDTMAWINSIRRRAGLQTLEFKETFCVRSILRSHKMRRRATGLIVTTPIGSIEFAGRRLHRPAVDLCVSDPKQIAQLLVDQGYTSRYDYALQALNEVRYDVWRDYDAEDTLRFYALRMHEAGLIKSSPQKIIAEHTDWRFLNELKHELKV